MNLAEVNPHLIAASVAAVVLLLAAWAETIHARRCRAVGRLAFGRIGKPRRWTVIVPPLRILAATALCWGFTILLLAPSEAIDTTGVEAETETLPEDIQRVILLLDVSPSMAIKDSGPEKNMKRRDRALEVMEAMFPRIALGRTRFSLIAFFTSARTVVMDASDTAVVRNVLDNLPLVWAFAPGKTNVIEGLKAAADLARDWSPKSTTLILCTDGDTVDFSQIPKLPRSIHQVQIYAVGDPIVGTFIDGHDSRQQAGILRRLAAELHGAYYDVNSQHVPTSALKNLAFEPPRPQHREFTWKDLALMAIAGGATLFLVLPIALEYFGCGWNADRELPQPRSLRSTADDEMEVAEEMLT